MRKHLAVLKHEYITALIDGKKTIEARLTKTKRQPWAQIDPGDTVYLKPAGRPVSAHATVAKIKTYENLDSSQILKIKEKYNTRIRGLDTYWDSKSKCRFAILIWLTNVKPIIPIRIAKKDQLAWRVLTENLNYGLGY